MAWRYRKRLKIIPGVHLNLSKSGVSATIGVRGMSVTYGIKELMLILVFRGQVFIIDSKYLIIQFLRMSLSKMKHHLILLLL